MNLSLTEQLAFCTARIECELTDHNTSVGTGFFFDFNISDISVPVIVTNRHVVRGSIRGRFQLTHSNSDGDASIGKFSDIVLDDFDQRWIPHPDAGVDLCVMPLAPLFRKARETGLDYFYRLTDESLIPEPSVWNDLTAIEDVLMVGYPAGLWDSVNNMPVFRRGITATHPRLDYLGRKEFLIDAACFQGSSGSPVFLYNSGSYPMRDGGIALGSRMLLLGILFAGPQQSIQGEIKVVPIPTATKPVSVSHIPINLGFVIKASRLLDFKPILAKMVAQSQQRDSSGKQQTPT